VATSSMVTEMVMGKTLEEAADLSNKAVAEALGGLPANKMHCSNLAADALHLAIQDYLVRVGREDDVTRILKALPKEHEHSSH
jgi:nitrogen fixation NifU-like protein